MPLPAQLTHEIRRGPSGPKVGAFFDLDQTLLAGFSASAFFRERLVSGMVLAIEPMVNAGGPEVLLSAEDGWTARTRDGSRSAHFEVCVAVTDNGPRILGFEQGALAELCRTAEGG